MAQRPIFIPFPDQDRLVKEVDVDFEWSPGFAPVQKMKNVVALHESARQIGYSPLLEVSTKSTQKLGLDLSAFNLPVTLDDSHEISLECAFQGSKVFEEGGPYSELYYKNSIEARRDERLRGSGKLVGFNFQGMDFPTEPKTAFYDWLYMNALARNEEIMLELVEYGGFTDIEFNPNKSINCQARSCALCVSLWKKGVMFEAMKSPQAFIAATQSDGLRQPHSSKSRQQELF